MGDRQESATPQAIPGFEFLTKALQSFGPEVQSALQGVFSSPGFSQLGDFGSILQGAAGGFGAQPAFQEGLSTGFMPDILGQVEAQLLPALERSQKRGSANIREEAINRGTLDSTGTTQSIGDLRGGLESGLLSNLAGITGNLAQGAQGIRGQLAGQGVGSILPGVQTALGGTQFAQQLPLQALGALSGGAQATPLFQPTFGPSKGEQVLGAATEVGGAAAGAKCWVAAALFHGWHDYRTHAARRYLMRHPLVWALYGRYGERLAALVERYDLLRRMLFPVFTRFARAGVM